MAFLLYLAVFQSLSERLSLFAVSLQVDRLLAVTMKLQWLQTC